MRETEPQQWHVESTRTNQALRKLREQGVDPGDALVAISTLDDPAEWIEEMLEAEVARKRERLRS